jgi:hypothetical protein
LDRQRTSIALPWLCSRNLAATDVNNIVGEREFQFCARESTAFISDRLKRFSLVLVFDATASSGLVRYKCKRSTLLLEEVIRDFQRRIERAETVKSLPQFTDEEIEELLGNQTVGTFDR